MAQDRAGRAQQPVDRAIDLGAVVDGEGLDPEKLRRAVELSEDTYCSVLAMLKPGAQVTRRIEINGKVI